MARPILTDEQWAILDPFIPELPPRRFRYPGRKPVGNRETLTGILFVLKTGIPWEDLPQEMGCGCGMTCWRRLRDWMVAGVWDILHRVLLDLLNDADQIDWSRASIDSSSVRAVFGGRKPGQIRRIGVRPAPSITS
jgi:transposase